MLRLVCLCCAIALVGCYGFADPGPSRLTARGEEAGAHLGQLPLDAPPGLSDLALGSLRHDDTGHDDQVLWALPEHRAQLWRVRTVGMPGEDGPSGLMGPRPGAALHQPLQLLPSLPIVGLRSEVDHEALAELGPHKLAIGTESQIAGRSEDLILVLDHDHVRATVSQVSSFPYGLWHMHAAANEGIEAMCAAAEHLLVASESVFTDASGVRMAPIGLTALPHKTFVPYFLRLPSATGRLSAMTCQANAQGSQLDVLAVERFFGHAQLVRFVVPLKAAPAAAPPVLQPQVLVDLTTWVHPLPNFEGIVRLPHGDVLLVSDNDTGGAARPATALLVPHHALGL